MPRFVGACIYRSDAAKNRSYNDCSCMTPFPTLARQMLRDLRVSPAAVSGERAASVFDAVVHNGLPTRESESGRSQTQVAVNDHEVMGNGGNGCELRGTGRKRATSRKSAGGQLCWSLFLEAMVSDFTRVAISSFVQRTSLERDFLAWFDIVHGHYLAAAHSTNTA